MWRGAFIALALVLTFSLAGVLTFSLAGCAYKMSLSDHAKADRITSTMKDIGTQIKNGTISHGEFKPMFTKLKDDIDTFKDTDSAPKMETFVVAVEAAYASYDDMNTRWEADISSGNTIDWNAIDSYNTTAEGHLAIAVTEQEKYTNK